MLFQPDVRYVYDRNEHYVPGQEPPSGLAGGKIVKVDRANWEAIDVQTAMAALQSGELDFVSDPLAHFIRWSKVIPISSSKISTNRAITTFCA
ncbi:ABC transporter substrate-binding protein [Bradyrhizobium sp. GM2.2]|uniref:ABC transporter substrate-binding protein n=1 Tax=Bradyrhizobium sp. GM2.2 TaxID=3156358 RepID=UPI0033969B75